MAKEKKGTPGAFVVILTFVGGIIGATTGLLLAPQSGKKTRERIHESYDEAVRKTNEWIKKAEETIPEVTSKVKEGKERVKGEILHIGRDTEEKGRRTLEKGKSYLGDVKNTLSFSLEEGKKKYKEEKEKHMGK